MDVIMFVPVNMRVTVLMVGLVGVGGFVLAAVAATYFTLQHISEVDPSPPLPVVVRVFVSMFLFMRMVMTLFAGVATQLSDPTRAEKRRDVIV